MANYESEMQKLMATFAPLGGFGIPNIGGVRNDLFNTNQSALRQAVGQDVQGFQQMGGVGRQVSQAFAPGGRSFQFSKQLHSDLIDLMSRHGMLAENQRQNLFGMLSPIAQERANRPSGLSSLLGGALGLVAQVAIPGLGGMIFGNPLEKALMAMFGQQQGGSGGYGGANTGNFNFGYTPRQ